MNTEIVPDLSADEIQYYFLEAENSERKRFPKILHNQGDYDNRVVNFVLNESYMQPHLHPGDEKIEKMFLVEGSFALILFDNSDNDNYCDDDNDCDDNNVVRNNRKHMELSWQIMGCEQIKSDQIADRKEKRRDEVD